MDNPRSTTAQIKARKNGEKITVLTAYDYPTAKLLDGEVDMILVGDSLGMVVYGFDSTTSVTMEMMALHTEAVARGSHKSLIIADMPYGSVGSPQEALKNAKLLISKGAQAVKIEGGAEIAKIIELLKQNAIEVMGHVGLLPQSVKIYGGYKVQGKNDADAARILNDARELEKAGCFAIVIEAVPETLAAKITAEISIPTIGIGASPKCDGQVLVIHDMLGITENPPKFVKTFASLDKDITNAARKYAAEVKAGTFPGKDNCY